MTHHERPSRLQNQMAMLESLEQMRESRDKQQKLVAQKNHPSKSSSYSDYVRDLMWGKTRKDQLDRSKIDAALTFSALTLGTIAICNGNIGLLGESLAVSLPAFTLFTLHHLGIPQRPNWK